MVFNRVWILNLVHYLSALIVILLTFVLIHDFFLNFFLWYDIIIKFGDYDTFNIINIPPNDSELEKAYTLLDVDYAVNITPSFFRSQYIKEINKSTDKDKRDAITKAYNSILSLIIKKDLDEDPDENLQLVSD